MLTVKNLSRTFNEGKSGFAHVNFTLANGEIIGVLGTSGCGKSTLLRVLAGLDDGYTGEVNLNSTASNDQIGMMFQEPRLMPWLSVEDNICFGKPSPKQKELTQQLIELVGLSGFEKHFPKDLSGGMAQRAAIARSLLVEPNILLLDEPFSALDAFTKMTLQDLLLSIWKERQTTMVLVTHDIDEAIYLCDRVFILRGQPGELYAEVKIDAARPRKRADARLTEKKEEILNLLDLNQSVTASV